MAYHYPISSHHHCPRGGRALTWLSLLSLLTVPIFFRLFGIMRRTEDWVLLDQYGKYVRMLYFFNGLAIILGVL